MKINNDIEPYEVPYSAERQVIIVELSEPLPQTEEDFVAGKRPEIEQWSDAWLAGSKEEAEKRASARYPNAKIVSSTLRGIWHAEFKLMSDGRVVG
jgi:hypothetical protein